MGLSSRPLVTAGVALVGAGFIAAPRVVLPHADVPVVALTSDSDNLGDGPVLIMGPSGFPIPTDRYVDAVENLYLDPHGFDGDPQKLFTPEGLYPLTGVKSLPFDTSQDQGVSILDSAIHDHLDDATAADPVNVFGFSQSSSVSSVTMSQLADEGVDSDKVHFTLVGDPNNPDGGLLERFNVPDDAQPSAPSLGITFDGATPSNLYPTDIYIAEYDGFADFPKYPLNTMADLNAVLGIIYEHATYADLTPDQIAGAHDLPTADPDSLTDYHMIEADGLPLAEPLRLIPFIGQPLYDLMEPDLKVLVNLGYGDIEHGWDQGPADVPTTFGVFPDVDLGDVFKALASGLQEGLTNAAADLQDPDNYKVTDIEDNPSLQTLISAAYTFGLVDKPDPSLLELGQGALSGFTHFPISDANLLSSPTDIVNDISGTLSADYSSLLPLTDAANALVTTLPSVGLDYISDHLSDGDVLGAFGGALAAVDGLVPFLAVFGAGPLLFDAAGTLINLVDFFDIGDMS
jgi:hypothetical protein